MGDKEGGDGDGVCVSRREHHGNEVDTKSERRHWSWGPLHLCSLLHHPDPVLLRLVARDRGVGKENQSQRKSRREDKSSRRQRKWLGGKRRCGRLSDERETKVCPEYHRRPELRSYFRHDAS